MHIRSITTQIPPKNLSSRFESCPQFILQSYFLLSLNTQRNNFDSGSTASLSKNWIVVVSIFFSLLSIASKKCTQDRELVRTEWQTLKPIKGIRSNIDDHGNVNSVCFFYRVHIRYFGMRDDSNMRFNDYSKSKKNMQNTKKQKNKQNTLSHCVISDRCRNISRY